MKRLFIILAVVGLIACLFVIKAETASREGSSTSAKPIVAYGVSSTAAGGGHVIKAISVDTNGVIQTG